MIAGVAALLVMTPAAAATGTLAVVGVGGTAERPTGAAPAPDDAADRSTARAIEISGCRDITAPGTYVYVCVPHAGQGMVGRVVVNE